MDVWGFESDRDGDGLSDLYEIALGTDLNNPDSDGNGIEDSTETDGGSGTDNDGDEIIDALDTDCDNDGLPDD